jgi:hypothetical protein
MCRFDTHCFCNAPKPYTRKIEPVGVFVLGIDGLRQDVLYAPEPSAAGDPSKESSYDDPTGCGGQPCYVNPATLSGLSQILRPDRTDKTIKLKDVSAIFPSLTFASWASIFTGKPQGPVSTGTGIVSNEFFARDLINQNPNGKYSWKGNIPGTKGYPPGVIALDGSTHWCQTCTLDKVKCVGLTPTVPTVLSA